MSEPIAESYPEGYRFPVVGKARWWVTDRAGDETRRKAFPALDLLAEYVKVLAWLDANPTKRKTSRGMPAFLFRWLERAQNRCGSSPPALVPARPGEPPWKRVEREQFEQKRQQAQEEHAAKLRVEKQFQEALARRGT